VRARHLGNDAGGTEGRVTVVADHQVCSCTRFDSVGASTGYDDIVAFADLDGVVASGGGVGAGNRRGPAGLAKLGIAIVANDEVVAVGRRDRIVAAAANDEIIAGAEYQRVVAAMLRIGAA